MIRIKRKSRIDRIIFARRKAIRQILKNVKGCSLNVDVDDLNDYVIQLLEVGGVKKSNSNEKDVITYKKEYGERGKYGETRALLSELRAIFETANNMGELYPEWELCNRYISIINNIVDTEKMSLAQLDFMLTERCTLKCRDCLNLMQYYKHPQNFSLENISRDLQSLGRCFGEIEELHILGGEPLISPFFYKVCQMALSLKNVKSVVVFTNATIVPKREDLELIKNVIFYLSDYGNERQKINEFSEVLDEVGISYYIQEFENQKWLSGYEIKQYDTNLEIVNGLFSRCAGKACPTVANGSLFYCEFLANATSLRAVPEHHGNGLDLLESTAQDVVKYMLNENAPNGCLYCSRLYDMKKSNLVNAAIQTDTPLEYIEYR